MKFADHNKVLLLIKERSHKRLLVNYLRTFEIVSLSPQNVSSDDVVDKKFDLVIVDLDTLTHHFKEVAAWRQSAEPLYLPVLLLVPTKAANSLSIELCGQFDALLCEQIERIELETAVATLQQIRQLSCQLQQQRQELAAATASKAQFTSTVAHELRNPLAVISSLTQLLRQRGEKMSLQKRDTMLARIQAAVNKLTKLIDGLLSLSRSASTSAKFSPKKVDLEGRCFAILNDFKLINKGIYEINFQVKGECSSLFVDPALISTILTNLISNALKYSPDDSPVSLVLERQDRRIIVEVRDNGQGIPIEDQSSLFEAFFRARNAGAIEGTGLGLSIVKQCVSLHGGTIEFQSEVGRGTTFRVMLPLSTLTLEELPLSQALYPQTIR